MGRRWTAQTIPGLRECVDVAHRSIEPAERYRALLAALVVVAKHDATRKNDGYATDIRPADARHWLRTRGRDYVMLVGGDPELADWLR